MPDINKRAQPCRIPQRQDTVYAPKSNPLALAKLLDEWMQGDETEQRETFEVLRRSLDEDRPEGARLFP
jgi:hypothetical protein